jgi:hypothetical protein
MAYRVAEMLGGAGKEEVLLHWAAAKISASPSVPDGLLKDALAAKVSLMDRPKYAPLAAHAQVRQPVCLRHPVPALAPDVILQRSGRLWASCTHAHASPACAWRRREVSRSSHHVCAQIAASCSALRPYPDSCPSATLSCIDVASAVCRAAQPCHQVA